ncbi:biotin--[acetyl-CoA-carboxylase] ligase [Lampropedia puyangensis]|uniref:Biotin--[acetyl-CoA-carboxylase] ligase n=1 Tax=Lampropedia puyangensis TaxID=1330072 RepID=A0A4S8FCV9_9BURK|nr:biotin--[acetyl-CoA-carboxylase] ligase [Lampropedia puyangensis]THU04434.1 biotin--[acetyl-CoA-carboxylase] ligase [Lampropedia puyangensis]
MHHINVPPSQRPLGIAVLEQAAQSEWSGIRVEWVPSIDSTNTELMRRASQGDMQACVLMAQEQTAGRGRMGKPWHMHAEQALALSIGVPLNPRDWSGLSLVVGLAVVSALTQWARQTGAAAPSPAERLGLKWPNDVWLMAPDGQGRKMAGILIETAGRTLPAASTGAGSFSSAATSSSRYAVIGMGVNLRPQALEGTSVPPANVQEWAGAPVEEQTLLALLVPSVLSAVRQFEHEGFAAYQQAFAAWDLLAGRPVALSDGRVGDGLGVDVQGELLVAIDGQVVSVTSGEVSVRPAVGGYRGV